jgi:hemerythrin-like domain-containing protein
MGMMDSLRRTGRRMADATAGEEGAQDILDTLKQEHRDVAEMLDRLVESESGPERKRLLASIRAALVPHLRAEQKVVYDTVIALKGKEQKEHGEEGYLEHDMAEKSLNSLFKVGNMTSPEFNAGAKVLKELVEHHVAEEEKDVWADVREHFSGEERSKMNRKFAAAKKRVRVPSAA